MLSEDPDAPARGDRAAGLSDASRASDGELARQIGEGARGAVETELCRRFAPRIRLYGLRHLGGEDRARDLVQAVLLAVLEALRSRRVKDHDHVDRFVLGTCRHLALRARHADARAEPTDTTQLETVVAPPETPLLDAAALHRCMAALDVRSQSVVFLSFYRERSAEEIAGALETTAGNVRVLRHRAVTQLRRCLERSAEGVR